MASSITESENSTDVSGRKASTGLIREWEHQQTLPADLTMLEAEESTTLSVEAPVTGTFSGRFASFDGFLVSQVTFQLGETTTCTCGARGQIIGMFFTLTGSCTFRQSGYEHSIKKGEHTIYSASDYEGKLDISPEGGQMQCLSIHIPADYYTRLFRGHSVLHDAFIEAMRTPGIALLPGGVMPMTLPMKWIINTIHSNVRSGVAKQLFLQAKILELLLLQVEQADTLGKQGSDLPSTAELEALLEAKTILERSLEHPPTIRHLAKMVGINEFSLKKGFKDTYHETIYGFVSRLKMEQARQMLLAGDKAIAEVAAMAGYKNPQHFTAAFKKYFGVLPSKFKH